ncbi:mce related protein [Rosistilla oblonga]|uniref:Mce related protein n=1 Tax=Rosistilla oblonga TaxID=2527990 RepID=A0A518IZX1_9BACT|nr:MlaD family protein [Rosistilla oblonga]QDV13175.1 mce related protein [Rosistilla oblonga]QDV58638.1 mce related protein [Rosistilla oblonga]
MDDRRLEFGVGVLVLASIGVSIILMFIFGAYPVLLKKEYPITANFPTVAGIDVDTPVVKFGYPIGRVTKIQLGAEGVDVMMMIDAKYPIHKNEIPRIGSQRLVTGEARIEFVKANEKQLLELFDGKVNDPPDGILQPTESAFAQEYVPEDGYYVRVTDGVSSDPFAVLMSLEGEFRGTLKSIEDAGKSVDSLASQLESNVKTLFKGDGTQVHQIAQQTSQTLEQVRSTAAEVESILKDTQMKEKLKASLDRFPLLLDDAQETMHVAQRAIQSFENVGDSVNDTVKSVDRTVRNIERFTTPLADNSDELVANVLRSLNNLDQVLVQVAYFTEQLNEGDGTIKRLIEDDELYWQVRRIAGNIENLTARVRPIVDDARVFADKIARDPGTLGVRGALSRRPQGAGLK